MLLLLLGWFFRDSLSIRLEEFSVVSGKRNGNYFLYHTNGQIKVQSIYLDGLLNGIDEHFSAIGTPTSLFNFSAGKKAGKSIYLLSFWCHQRDTLF